MPLYIEKEKEATTLSEEYPDAGFIVIPNSIERRTDIDFTDKHIYGLIFSFTANGQVFYGSNGYIQRRLGMSDNTVAKSLKNLEDKKLIQRTIVNKNERTICANIWEGDTKSLGRVDTKGLGIYNIQEDKQVNNSTPLTNTKNTNKKTAIHHSEFLELFNTLTGRKFKLLDQKTKRQVDELFRAGYTVDDYEKAIKNAMKDTFLTGDNKNNKNYLTPEFISRSTKFEDYLNGGIKPVRTGDIREIFNFNN